MSSIWNKNISLFCFRFPQLAKNLRIDENTPEPTDDEIPYKIEIAKNGFPTATYNGVYLHSKYSPNRVDVAESTDGAFLFLGIGLGYGVVEIAKKNPKSTLIIAEPFPIFFFTALRFVDFEAVFKCEKCVVALGAKENDVMGIVENYGGVKNCIVVSQKQQIQHAVQYFENIKILIARGIKKDKVNQWTLEKFGKLWKKNGFRNLEQYKKCRGIEMFKNCLGENSSDIPVLILAAGPTLDEILPHLQGLKQKMLIVCVDTALKAALRVGCEPDFVLLLDPQYYAFRHIAALSSPNSILITESAAYPAAFRFDCKEILLCSSLFPLGKYIENKIGEKGRLEAGGSVSTSAWDFGKFLGAKKIYFSGLDLGYPEKQTHIKGSSFEESAHKKSNRLSPAEKISVSLLFGANMRVAFDYNGNPILTDDRMQLFASWFETNIENAKTTSPELKTFTLSSRSLKIPGFEIAKIEDLLNFPDAKEGRAEFFKNADNKKEKLDEAKTKEIETVINELYSGLEKLKETAKKGKRLADDALHRKLQINVALKKLEELDNEILKSDFKEIAALVFPSGEQLEKIYAASALSENPEIRSLQKSKIIYSEIEKACLI